MHIAFKWLYGECHVWVIEQPEVKGSGKSPEAAVGNMIMNNMETFGFSKEVTYVRAEA